MHENSAYLPQDIMSIPIQKPLFVSRLTDFVQLKNRCSPCILLIGLTIGPSVEKNNALFKSVDPHKKFTIVVR